MTDIQKTVHLPIDDDGFLRRQCPYCMREFKAIVDGVKDSCSEDEQTVEDQDENELSESIEYYCPYCSQPAGKDSWWTLEQLDFIERHAQAIGEELINEHLIEPLSRMSKGIRSKGMISIEVKANRIDPITPIINPEPNDMRIIQLECCNERIKILDEWKEPISCYYCGSKHTE